MSTRRITLSWAALLLIALGVRLLFLVHKAGMHFPDEIFQYLEPAYHRLHGDAWLAWEFERGARNWVLPAFWGCWLAIGDWLGLAGWGLHRFCALHSALLSLALVPAGYRLGRAAAHGSAHREALGWAMAYGCAIFPVFGFFAPHTLSEGPGLVLTTWAYALWLELVGEDEPEHDPACVPAAEQLPARRRKALAVGVLLGAAFVVRYSLAVFTLLPLIDFAARRRRLLPAVASGLLAVLGMLMVIDAITWGRPLGSVLEFYRSNRWALVAPRTADTAWYAYLQIGWAQAGVTALALVLLSFASLRRWPLLCAAWLVPLLAFSALANRQARFVLSIWPLLLCAGLAGALILLERGGLSRRLRGPALLLVTVMVSAVALPATLRLPQRFLAGVFAAQNWIGQQQDATGVLLDGGTNANGGYLLLRRSIPQVPYSALLSHHRLFNYLIAYKPQLRRSLQLRRDLRLVRRFEEALVFRRITPASRD